MFSVVKKIALQNVLLYSGLSLILRFRILDKIIWSFNRLYCTENHLTINLIYAAFMLPVLSINVYCSRISPILEATLPGLSFNFNVLVFLGKAYVYSVSPYLSFCDMFICLILSVGDIYPQNVTPTLPLIRSWRGCCILVSYSWWRSLYT